jgi:hypothetical protein
MEDIKSHLHYNQPWKWPTRLCTAYKVIYKSTIRGTSPTGQPKELRVIYSTIINRTIMSGNDLQDYGRHDKSFTSKLLVEHHLQANHLQANGIQSNHH